MMLDERFSEGSILYFDPFLFPDGGLSKPKYFIVLKQNETSLLLASLPTSKDNVPAFVPKKHGCIERPEINFNCYYFDPTIPICDSGFSFPKETYVYGFRLQMFDAQLFLRQETDGRTVITQKGILVEREYKAIIECLAQSNSVKRRFKALLTISV